MPGDPEVAAALLLGFLNEAAGLIAAAPEDRACGAGSATRWTSSSRGSSADVGAGPVEWRRRRWEDWAVSGGGRLPHEQSRSAMSDFVMTIAGEAVPTEDTFGVHNPATGEVFAQAPECTRQQLDAAFDAAAKAARDWKADEAARRAILLQAADVLMGADGRSGAGADGRAGQAAERRRHRGLRLGHLVPVLRQPRDADPDHPGRRHGLRGAGPAPARRRGRHHAVELPADARLLEDRPGAAGRQHARAQALALHAADHAEGRRAAARRLPARAWSTS